LREFELAFPSWREDTSFVLTALQTMLREQSAAGEPEKLQAQRIRATQQVRAQLGFGPRRLFFNWLLHLTQKYSVIRENLKYTFVLAHHRLRLAYLALAKQLQQRGALQHPDDIFYLTGDEIDALASGTAKAGEFQHIIRARKTEFQRAE
jgi:pyruvate,water dikinase